MTNIDGEYMAIGRKTVETSNVLTPFAGPSQRSVNITGTGFQEVEFADGFRMSIRANMPMTVSTDVVNGVSSSMLTNNMMPVSKYFQIHHCGKLILLTRPQTTFDIWSLRTLRVSRLISTKC